MVALLCALGDGVLHPGKGPRAAVDPEVLTESQPLSGHGAAHGVNDELDGPVVGGTVVVARRRGALGPRAGGHRALQRQVQVQLGALFGRKALPGQAAATVAEYHIVLAGELPAPPAAGI